MQAEWNIPRAREKAVEAVGVAGWARGSVLEEGRGSPTRTGGGSGAGAASWAGAGPWAGAAAADAGG